jgi:hypothetical protein
MPKYTDPKTGKKKSLSYGKKGMKQAKELEGKGVNVKYRKPRN